MAISMLDSLSCIDSRLTLISAIFFNFHYNIAINPIPFYLRP